MCLRERSWISADEMAKYENVKAERDSIFNALCLSKLIESARDSVSFNVEEMLNKMKSLPKKLRLKKRRKRNRSK